MCMEKIPLVFMGTEQRVNRAHSQTRGRIAQQEFLLEGLHKMEYLHSITLFPQDGGVQ